MTEGKTKKGRTKKKETADTAAPLPSLLMACVCRPDLNPKLQRLSNELFEAAASAAAMARDVFSKVDAAWVVDTELDEASPQSGGKFTPNANARNAFLAEYLDGHDLVFWVDADIVDYDPTLPIDLWLANPGGVTAPLVLIEGRSQFYDTLGFILNGARIDHRPPYFRGVEIRRKFVNLDSVGSTYIIPSVVYDTAVYAHVDYDPEQHHPSIARTGHTDHWPIMRAAADMGIRIGCYTGSIAYHADLPKYGHRWN